jgi:DNA-binding response OmpR family regulator
MGFSHRQRSDMAEMVASLGFEVETAGDGQEALAKLAHFPANAFLTDVMMPRMDGKSYLTFPSIRRIYLRASSPVEYLPERLRRSWERSQRKPTYCKALWIC